jgi:hypothetical protein
MDNILQTVAESPKCAEFSQWCLSTQGYPLCKAFSSSKGFRIRAPPLCGYVSCGLFYKRNKLIILQELQDHLERISIDKPMQIYRDLSKEASAIVIYVMVYKDPKGNINIMLDKITS